MDETSIAIANTAGEIFRLPHGASWWIEEAHADALERQLRERHVLYVRTDRMKDPTHGRIGTWFTRVEPRDLGISWHPDGWWEQNLPE